MVSMRKADRTGGGRHTRYLMQVVVVGITVLVCPSHTALKSFKAEARLVNDNQQDDDALPEFRPTR